MIVTTKDKKYKGWKSAVAAMPKKVALIAAIEHRLQEVQAQW